MATLFALHPPAAPKLRLVLRRMRRLGAPILYAYWRRDAWYALEGSHRIAAASKLGWTPILRPVTLASRIDHDTHDVNSRQVRDLLAYYDEMDWWVRHEFADLQAPVRNHQARSRVAEKS